MKIIKVVLLAFGVYLFFLSTELVQAEENVGFSVQAILPENQIDDRHSYFDLKVEPEDTQELEVVIYNNETKDIRVKTSVHNASTNSNGLIVYEDQDETDPSLLYPMTNILTLENKEFVIPAGETISVYANLKVPKEPFKGILLGGLHFEKVVENERKEDEGISIQNKYAYVIGVQLTHENTLVSTELRLNSITPTLVNYRTAILANIQNKAPVIVRDLDIQAKVFKDGETEPIKTESYEAFKMAPNSNMDVVINWENQALEAGDYRLEIQANTPEDKWTWDELFTIDAEAEELNEKAVELEDNSYPAWVWMLIGLGIALVVCVIVLLLYIRKLKKQ